MGIKKAFSFPFGWRLVSGWAWEGRFGARMVGDQAEWAWGSRFGARLTEGRWCGGAVAVSGDSLRLWMRGKPLIIRAECQKTPSSRGKCLEIRAI